MNRGDYIHFITRTLNSAPEDIQVRIGKKMIEQMTNVSKPATFLAWKGYTNVESRKKIVRNQTLNVLKPTYNYIVNKYGRGSNANAVTVATVASLRRRGGPELVNAYGNYIKMERKRRKENQAIRKIKKKRT